MANLFKNLFKQKCPVCKMEIRESFVEGFGKKFCSEQCREEYRKKLMKENAKPGGGGSCH